MHQKHIIIKIVVKIKRYDILYKKNRVQKIHNNLNKRGDANNVVFYNVI